MASSQLSTQRIPLELKLMILGQYGLTRQDLAALCLVRPFSTAGQIKLYHSYDGDYKSIALFLSTILQHKALAQYVKHVYLHGLHAPSSPTNCLETNQLNLFICHAKRLPIAGNVRSQWVRLLRHSHGEALAALLIAHLPQLQKLEIREEYQYTLRERGLSKFLILGQPIWTFTLSLHAKRPSRLPRFGYLRTIKLHCLPFSAQALSTFFSMPAVRSLHVWDVFESRIRKGAFGFGTSYISDLSFTNASISLTSLKAMILSCKSIIRFAYNCPADSHISRQYPELLEILSSFADTVETLTFRDQHWWSRNISPIRQLTPFLNLHHFTADSAVVCQDVQKYPLSSIFPACIRSIQLLDVFPSLLAQLGTSGLLNDLQVKKFPHLSKITLVRGLVLHGDGINDEIAEMFFVENGIKLEILNRVIIENGET